MYEEKPETPGQKKFVNYFLVAMTVLGCVIGAYLATHREVLHPRPVEYKNITLISDINNDNIPDLRVQYKNNSIDTLLSQKENDKIIYHP